MFTQGNLIESYPPHILKFSRERQTFVSQQNACGRAMNRFSFLFLLLNVLIFHVNGQPTDSPSGDPVHSFQPSLAVVIGILCIMFGLTFLLLIYAKFCHRNRSTSPGDLENRPPFLLPRSRRYSGIDKTVIESLPFFRFSSLKGTREGLECAVCLSKFEDIEILRLLPKCKHAFHIDCIDHWLVSHSSCPLCRQKISAEDTTIFTYSNSLRFLSNQSEVGEDSNIELFVQREEDDGGSSRFCIGSSFRKTEKGDGGLDRESLIQEEVDHHDDNYEKFLHKHNHKIIVSDFVLKNRWSCVSSSDLIFLNSEMLNATSSSRFRHMDFGEEQKSSSRPIESEEIQNIKEEIERKRLFESKVSALNKNSPDLDSSLPASSSDPAGNLKFRSPAEKRSMSEITAISRFGDIGMKKKILHEKSSVENNAKEARVRQLWLPIARRTVQWFVNRERRAQQFQQTQQPFHV